MKERRQCLIIDDDVDDQEIFLMCLKKINNNIDCATASDSTEAMLTLLSDDKYTPDYIFLDVNMPKMNGIECLRQIKRIERLKNTSVFMYSTSSESATVATSKDLGAQDFIVKPAKTADLKEKLAVIFNVCSEIEKK